MAGTKAGGDKVKNKMLLNLLKDRNNLILQQKCEILQKTKILNKE